jgi:hypothetical protein
LFRPGYAVQARELTQLQTILQEQIRRHGDHMFKEGAMVIPGQISYDLNLNYVKLSFSAGVQAENILSGLVGKEIKNSAGLVAKVITYTLKENDDLDTIFVKYQNSVQTITGVNLSEFNPTDILSPVDGSTGYDVTVADTGLPTGKGCSATIQRGVFYIKKNFVLVTDQTIILDKYTTTPSYRVGLKLTEDVVYPEDNENLLDNALGSPNYSAPGAARYSMDLVLSKIVLRSTANPTQFNNEADEDFIDLLTLQDGKVLFKVDRTQYAELEKTLARRTYDESGDYSLSPFNMQVREFRNNLRGDWAPAEKYIQGDIIKVTDGSTGFWYFVAVTSGTSSSLASKPAMFKSNKPTGFSLQTLDSITDNDIVWEYALYPDFNQGVYTFTGGDSEYAQFTLNDHIRLAGYSCIGVEAGKAYVRGYEIEKLSTEFLAIQKSRNLPAASQALSTFMNSTGVLPAVTDSISPYKTVNIDLSSGSYVNITGLDYFPDLLTLPTVNLHNAVKGSISTATVIGTARVRAIEKVSYSGSASAWTYKLFLFDVKINAGKNFKDVRSVTNNTNSSTAFKCNIILDGSDAILYNPTGDSLIYSLPDYAVSDVSEVTYTVTIPYTQTASSTQIVVNATSGYSFTSIYDFDNYTLMNNNTGVPVALTAGSNMSISGSSITITGLTNGQSYTLLATMVRADAVNAQVNFAVADAAPMQLTSSAAATARTITLNNPYVTRITSILMDARGFNATTAATPIYSVNITSRYTFKSGQKTTHMDLASIELNAGETAPTGPIRIAYEYLNPLSVSAGGFFSVNSYTYSDDSRVTYDQIYSVSNKSLRDSIDFRPIASGAGFVTKYFPKYGATASIKYSHY